MSAELLLSLAPDLKGDIYAENASLINPFGPMLAHVRPSCMLSVAMIQLICSSDISPTEKRGCSIWRNLLVILKKLFSWIS